MNFHKLDDFQYRHKVLAFPVAVLKKYGDDQASNHAALFTYFGFLALFPLLLVATTVLQIVASSHPTFHADVVRALTGNSSSLSYQLSAHIQGLHRTGIALIVGIVFLIYGARGVASAFRNAVNSLWGIPHDHMLGFPQSMIKDVATVVFGGMGLIIGVGITGTVAALGHGMLPRLLSYWADFIILALALNVLFRFVLVNKIEKSDTRFAAIVGAIGLVALQVIGGYILARLLKNLDALYSYFALSIGLMFWIYLQAQIIYYSIEISLVKSRKLWPAKIIK
jgi:membrane protein